MLRVLWDRGPATVRGVMNALQQRGGAQRAYTSVMSLMNVMADKGLLARTPQGKAFVYSPKALRDSTLGSMLGDLLDRAFDGSASGLVLHLLKQSSLEELEAIRKTIDAYRRERRGQ